MIGCNEQKIRDDCQKARNDKQKARDNRNREDKRFGLYLIFGGLVLIFSAILSFARKIPFLVE